MASFAVRISKSKRPFKDAPGAPAVQLVLAGTQSHSVQGSDIVFMDDIQSDNQIDDLIDNLIAHLEEVRKDAKQELSRLHDEKLRNDRP